MRRSRGWRDELGTLVLLLAIMFALIAKEL
jgi:hypothetical protein